MNQDLFCGTVILEQGKTGRFMELKPGDQVDHVKNLLGLNIYSLYYDKAKELANQRRRDARTKEDELEKLADTTVKTVQDAESGVQRLQDILSQIEKDIQALDQLYTKVQIVEGLRGELTNVSQKITQFETQLTHKNEIEMAVQIVQDWEQVEPLLREIRQARRQFTDQQKRVADLQDELAKKRQELFDSQKALDEQLRPDYDKIEDSLQETKESLEIVRKQLAESQKQGDLIKAELDLDFRQNEIQAQQQDRQQQLKELPQVEADYHLWIELNQVIPKLDSIVSDLLEGQEEATAFAKSQQLLVEGFETLKKRRIILDQLKEQNEELGANLEASQKLEEKIRGELNVNETLLKKREDAHGQSKCPTCGTSLEGKELDRFHQELIELRDKVESGKSTLDEAHQNTLDLREKAKAIDKQYRQEEKAIEHEGGRLTTEQRNLETRKTQAGDQKKEALRQWEGLEGSLNYSAQLINAPTTECLELASKQFKAISDIQKTYKELIQTQADFKAAQVELDQIEGQRQYAAETFSQSQLEEANNSVVELDNAVQQTEQRFEEKGKDERRLYQLLTKKENEIHTLTERIQEIEEKLIPQEQKSLVESEHNQQVTCHRFEERLATLDWSIQNLKILQQAAENDQQAEQMICAWVDKHRPLAKQISELRKAEKEIGDLRSKYSTLDEQIKGFPDEVQQGQGAIIEKDLQVKRTEKNDKKVEHEQWQKKAWEETQRLSQKQNLQIEHEQLITEEKDFRDLATLLEPPGQRSAGGPLLQAIMRDALANVAERASDILEEWGQSTQIMVPQDALEFKVIDLASGSSERHYQLFSGGEKFMVALAMALAIGEVASDTGHTDCLFIDEGFGLLDKENRAYVAQEIVNKLVSSGRRKQVVVITHMEDIQEAFPDRRSRFHLVNDGTATRLLVGDDDASP